MGIADAFRKNKQEKENKAAQPPAGHTVAEILKDKEKSDLFGQLLKREGKEELALRLAEGKLEYGDMDLLESQRILFSEAMERSEKIGKMLSAESITELGRNNQNFERIVNLLGIERAAKVIRGQLMELAINDEQRFNRIGQRLEDMEKYRKGEYKEINDQVEKLCKESGITPKEYLDALAIEDKKEKEKKLKELAQKAHVGFKKFINIITLGKYGKNLTLAKLMDGETSLEDVMKKLDQYYEEIGQSLSYTVENNQSMRQAMSQELIGEKGATASQEGFGDAKKEAGDQKFDETKFDKEWEAYKKAADYDAHPGDQETIKDMFIDEQQKKYGGKGAEGGFWASIFTVLFEKKIKNKRSTLK